MKKEKSKMDEVEQQFGFEEIFVDDGLNDKTEEEDVVEDDGVETNFDESLDEEDDDELSEEDIDDDVQFEYEDIDFSDFQEE